MIFLEVGRRRGFPFFICGRRESLVPNVAGYEIHTTVTYDPETHFDVNKNKSDDRFGGNRVLK